MFPETQLVESAVADKNTPIKKHATIAHLKLGIASALPESQKFLLVYTNTFRYAQLACDVTSALGSLYIVGKVYTLHGVN